MAKLPLVGLGQQHVLGEGHPLPPGQGEHDLLELAPVGDRIMDPHPEAGREGEFFLQSVRVVDVVLVLHVRPVLPGLPDQVPAVGGGVEQDVVGLGLHAPFDDRLEEFILHLVLLKGQVVDENDEAVVPVLHHGDDRRQIPELVLINLDHPQALVIVFVDEGLDAGGLARAGVAVEQHVVAAPSGQESLGVVPQLGFLALIAHQIPEHHLVGVVNGDQRDPLGAGPDAEGFVQADLPHAVLPVVVGDQTEKVLLVPGRRQPAAQVPDLLADVPVVPPLVLVDGGIVAEGGEAVDAQVVLNGREVIVEQGAEHPEVVGRKVVHRSLQRPHPLGDEAEGILIGHDEKGQIVLPQVFVKAVVGGQIQQALDLVVELPHQGLPGRGAPLPRLEGRCQAGQNAVLPQIAVEQQPGYQLIHLVPPSVQRGRRPRPGAAARCVTVVLLLWGAGPAPGTAPDTRQTGENFPGPAPGSAHGFRRWGCARPKERHRSPRSRPGRQRPLPLPGAPAGCGSHSRGRCPPRVSPPAPASRTCLPAGPAGCR